MDSSMTKGGHLYHSSSEEEPVSPPEQYFNSTILCLTNVIVMESEVPLHESPIISLLQDYFLPAVPRFSFIMVTDESGRKRWRRVDVNLQNHVKIPLFPTSATKPQQLYDHFFDDYLSNVTVKPLPQDQPLWDIHLIRYPTSKAAGSIIFRIHQSMGDGYSVVTALLGCFKRVDDPSLPLTLPTTQIRSFKNKQSSSLHQTSTPHTLSLIVDTVSDFWWTFNKSILTGDEKTPIRSGDIGILEFRPVEAATVTFALDHVKQMKVDLGATINDVITTVIFLGTRLYMKAIDKKSSDSESTAVMLFNIRTHRSYMPLQDIVKPTNTELESSSWGNHVTYFYVPIPKLTNFESLHPLDAIKTVHEIIKKKRNSSAVHLGDWIESALDEYAGPEAAVRYIYKTLTNTSMSISNLIGPLEKITFANHPMKSMYFFTTGCPQNLGVTIYSYMGTLQVTLAAEKNFIDVSKLKSCVENAFTVLLKAASKIPAKM